MISVVALMGCASMLTSDPDDKKSHPDLGGDSQLGQEAHEQNRLVEFRDGEGGRQPAQFD